MTENLLREAASGTPDPERSIKNLTSFAEKNPEAIDGLLLNLRSISLLFSYSQFLANFSIAHPDILFHALCKLDLPLNREDLFFSLNEKCNETGQPDVRQNLAARNTSYEHYMAAVRHFKVKEILRITLRDILKKTDLIETMLELSCLADVITEYSLKIISGSMKEIYGVPTEDAFSVIALGKLGGEELNFSSDIDLIFVYRTENGETSGVKTEHGIGKNKISDHEYYCKLGEAMTRFLSLNTGDGFAYRVDLRLRPEGQRGDIAMSLRGYEMYYESWGRAWERAMLLRARPVAGDRELGNNFLEMIRPFVYRKYLDFSSIDEIRSLKTRIDSKFKKGDIKRGYGGIREIEFFAQALQLIYGGREPLLRERSILKILHRLLQKSLIGQGDYGILSENYRFFRTIEHRLQQLNDIQTHTLPAGREELQALAKKTGFTDENIFSEDLEKRRTRVRSIYDSLFAEQKEEPSLSGTLFDEELSDTELREYISDIGLLNTERAVRNIKSIKDSIYNFQTLRGRRLLSEILPLFVDAALKTGSPDASLNHLQSFAQLLSTHESYLDVFYKNRSLIKMLTNAFSESEYLSKMLMGKPLYLEMAGSQEILKKSLSAVMEEIKAGIAGGYPVNEAIRIVKQIEEIRLGLLFLQKKISIDDVIKGLSKTAEAVLSVCIEHISEGSQDIAVVGFGKFGGREITFNSDLDIIFVCPGEVEESHTKIAERLLRMLISYTREGIAYRVDTRLRPEGSKGPLVSSLESFRKYYSGDAAFWEFQALLKARPVAGNKKAGLSFVNLAKDTLISKREKIPASDIRQMRTRIIKELSKEAEGYDIKLGHGGIEDIEFAVQYLQINNCHKDPKILVQGTVKAIDRLKDADVITGNDAEMLRSSYTFYRTLESFLRLKGENILRRLPDKERSAAVFMGFENREEFIETLENRRTVIHELTNKYLK